MANLKEIRTRIGSVKSTRQITSAMKMVSAAKLRKAQDAIIGACLQRFRPILLATFTTVLGLIPLYLGGGEIWEPMAVTIMIGLLFGTVITLLFIPSFYCLLLLAQVAPSDPSFHSLEKPN